MPRPRAPEPYLRWNVSVPATLSAQIETRLWDPVLQKPRYGDKSTLVCQLLERWLAEQNDPTRPSSPIEYEAPSHV